MSAPARRPSVSRLRNQPARARAGGRPPVAQGDDAPPLVICPYLLAEGRWRSTEPRREHRCTAVEPPVVIATDKQRRLCLDAAHAECPAFIASRSARSARLGAAGDGASATFVRTAPTVLDVSRPALSAQLDRIDRRRAGQAGLVGLMLVALAAVVFSRLPTESAARPTPTPVTTASIAASVMPSASLTPTPSPAPSTSASPSTLISPPPSSGPSPSASGTQAYRVKAGDTLTRIAAQYHTTVAAIQQLNGIKDPRTIRPGQVLQIP